MRSVTTCVDVRSLECGHSSFIEFKPTNDMMRKKEREGTTIGLDSDLKMGASLDRWQRQKY